MLFLIKERTVHTNGLKQNIKKPVITGLQIFFDEATSSPFVHI